MELLSIGTGETRRKRGFPLLAHGFRPFFLLASAYGAVFLLLWMLVFYEALPSPSAFPVVLLHGHEMVFGFAMAAMCGFLLTATATWSRLPPVTGFRLGVLIGLWFLGRVVMWFSAYLPIPLVAIADLALVPVLAIALGPILLSPGNRQNLILLVVLAGFFGANLLVHLELLTDVGRTAGSGLRLGVDLLTLLIVIVIGRIVPTFCRVSRLGEGKPNLLSSRLFLEAASIGSVALFLVADLMAHQSPWVGFIALGAAAVQIVRMASWRAGTLLRKPFMWALHLGYTWVILGLFLRGVSYLNGPVPEMSGLHALTIGGIGTTILAVMSIVGLLHTGRPAEIHACVTLAYVLVSFSAVLRITAPIFLYDHYKEALIVAALAWALAFGLYAVAYWPILSKPRPDRIPG